MGKDTTEIIHTGAPACRLNVIGGCFLETASGAPVILTNRKAAALLAFLAVGEQARAPRGRLTGLLWSERGEEQVRASLRQCLRRLRVALSESDIPVLLTEGQEVALAHGGVATDIGLVLEQLEAGEALDTVTLGGLDADQILYGFDDLDPAYTSWLQVTRKFWNDRINAALQNLIEAKGASAAQRNAAAQVIFLRDPTSETAAEILIRAHIASGSLSAALSVYDDLWQALDDSWGEEPSASVQDLIVKARTDEPQGSTTPVAEIITTPPKIMLKPFSQAGPWSKPDYFVDGFRQELAASLVRFREWVVLDPNADTPPEYQIEAGYFEASDGLQLTVMLKDCTAAQYVVSESLSLDFDDWGASVRRIVRRLAVALNVHIVKSRLVAETLVDKLQEDVFDIWLNANNLMGQYRPDRFERAESLFRQVIDKAPDYAPAYSSIASINNVRHLAAPGTERRADWIATAQEFATKAVLLDPLDTRCQIAVAWSHAMAGHFGQAELHFGLSHQLNPINPQTLIPCAHGLSFCGAHEKANNMADEAMELYPSMSPKHWGYAMCIRFFAKRFGESIEAGQHAGDAIHDLLGWHAAAYAKAGDVVRARQTGEAFLDAARENWMGDAPPEPEAITGWFMRSFPISSAADRRLLREGLRGAGLPVPA